MYNVLYMLYLPNTIYVYFTKYIFCIIYDQIKLIRVRLQPYKIILNLQLEAK